MASFQHTPLDLLKRMIRVVLIDGPLSASGEITGTLRQIPLVHRADDRLGTVIGFAQQNYAALSYTWGPPPPTRIILIDGKPLEIRENLWQFLDVWRGRLPQIFIDQICIDQNSDLEKNHQVSLMGDIYRAASEVHVWLGPASDASYDAMCLIRDPSRVSMTPADRRCISSLLNRDYWARIWIVQEMILGGVPKTQIHCGFQTVTSIQMYIHFQKERAKGLSITAHSLIASSNGIWQTKSKAPNIEWIDIQEFFHHQCSNILDKVYGLQGLLDPKHRAQVEYQISVEELFFRSFRTLLHSTITMQSQSLRKEPQREDWRKAIGVVQALGRAMNLTFPPALVMELVLMEMKILGVKMYDSTFSPVNRVRPWRSPKDYPELLRLAHKLWPTYKIKSREIEYTDSTAWWVSASGTPPPSYLEIRNHQKLRYLEMLRTASHLEAWCVEQEEHSREDTFSDLSWGNC